MPAGRPNSRSRRATPLAPSSPVSSCLLTGAPSTTSKMSSKAQEEPPTDVEKQPSLQPFSASQQHPRNWPDSKRWKNALIIAVTGFLSTTGSSIFVPAAPLIREEFGISNREVVTMTTALYVLGLGAGPFAFAPISELYGRQTAYSVSMLGFTAFNLGCCFADNIVALIVLRFFAGVFGSSGPGLGVATISDLFAPRERGRPLSIYAIGPMLGPVLGSIVGNYLVLIDWRWCFRLMTILVGLNTLVTIFGMEETYEPVLKKLYEARGGAPEAAGRLARAKAIFKKNSEAKEVVIRTFTRPPRMLMNPVCALFVTYYAYVYSCIYIFLVSLPLLFSKHDPPLQLFSYNWPAGTAGLCYIGLGVGFLSAATVAANLADPIYKYCSARYNNDGQPEYRLVITQVGMCIFPLGVLMWAWTAEAQTHWIGPLIGSAILGFALMASFNSLQNFIVDQFAPYSAAAMAAASLMRSITGCILPIFSESLFLNLGYGWGGTVLACIAVPAIPAPVLLWYYGPYLRERFVFKP
ncbi:major facilitator superfamily domain-containing protein [Leucosporidium creatinivorum]|uniref:Major facilitator superfamily domain-containing protein n=1 Tax=Leucosporidium creatinivorum TaxID=106004 RepID=A0A1Y2FJQ0_9BASI|nr:major facilitator superfamily domain-containing protein [Leucosporidium creatinivorum]